MPACFIYLSLVIRSHIATLTAVECFLVHSIIKNVASFCSSALVTFDVNLKVYLYVHGYNNNFFVV